MYGGSELSVRKDLPKVTVSVCVWGEGQRREATHSAQVSAKLLSSYQSGIVGYNQGSAATQLSQ